MSVSTCWAKTGAGGLLGNGSAGAPAWLAEAGPIIAVPSNISRNILRNVGRRIGRNIKRQISRQISRQIGRNVCINAGTPRGAPAPVRTRRVKASV